MRVRGPKSVDVTLNLQFLEISGSWEPNDAERQAAWELYVELITRIAVVPVPGGHGLLREALTSLYSIFGSTREVLRRHGPAVAEPKRDGSYSFGYLAVAVLNFVVRPLLTEWHPALEDWEAQRPAHASSVAHERGWPRQAELRQRLDDTRVVLASYAAVLADACGVPSLVAAVPLPPAAPAPE
jgi:hypothetical protein